MWVPLRERGKHPRALDAFQAHLNLSGPSIVVLELTLPRSKPFSPLEPKKLAFG
jgi:hypothetical protein